MKRTLGAVVPLVLVLVASIGCSPKARCRDGSLSYSASRSGTCAGHQGVAEWLTAPARTTPPVPAVTPALVRAPVSAPAAATTARDARGRIQRSDAARHAFARKTGFYKGRPGYVIDHIVALACGGLDAPSNMQWQTEAEAKAKDKVERKGC